MQKSWCGMLMLTLLLTTPWAICAQPLQKKFSFGVVPQQNPTALAKSWTPILNYLSQKTGYKFELHTAKDISSFNKRLKAGAFDFAYMNPWLYAIDESHIYKVFAKEKDQQLKGIIVVAKNSSYTNIKSLRNTTMAFPDPDAFAATLIPLAHLEKAGITVTLKNVMSHDSVYRAVAKGLYPAGGGVIKTLEKADPTIQDQLQILWISPPYTPHPIAANARVPEEVIKKLFAAMSTMHLDSRGKTLLEEIKFRGIVLAEDHEYDEIRALQKSSVAIQ